MSLDCNNCFISAGITQRMEYYNLKTAKILKTTLYYEQTLIPVSNGFILLSAAELNFHETILKFFTGITLGKVRLRQKPRLLVGCWHFVYCQYLYYQPCHSLVHHGVHYTSFIAQATLKPAIKPKKSGLYCVSPPHFMD